MKSEGKFSVSPNLKPLASGQEHIDDLEQLVGCRNHGLPVGESFVSLLRVIVTDYGIPGVALSGHDVAYASEVCIAVLGDVAGSILLTGLVDSGIRSDKGNELLVAAELRDVLNFGHELAGCGVTDSGNGSEDVDFLGVYLHLMCIESFRKLLVSCIEMNKLFRGILDHVASVGNSDASTGELPDVFNTEGRASSSSFIGDGGKDIFVGCSKDLSGTSETGQEVEHCGSKDIQRKDFRPCDTEICLELGLCSGNVLDYLLSSSGYGSDFIVHAALLLPEHIVMKPAVFGNGKRIRTVGLCLSETVCHDLLLDQQRVDAVHVITAIVQEPEQRYMVQACGLHNEHGVFCDVRICEKPMESLMGHQAGAFGKPVVSFGDDSVIELALCDVYSNYYGHCTTSRVRKDGSLNPISRVEGSFKLNQPIGITRELGQTPLEALTLRPHVALSPINYKSMSSLWGINY